mgnify:CR=1 FL=1
MSRARVLDDFLSFFLRNLVVKVLSVRLEGANNIKRISGGGLVRIDEIDEIDADDDAWSEQEAAESWITPEPELLAADLRLALEGGPVVMAVDPLRQRFKSAI